MLSLVYDRNRLFEKSGDSFRFYGISCCCCCAGKADVGSLPPGQGQTTGKGKYADSAVGGKAKGEASGKVLNFKFNATD